MTQQTSGSAVDQLVFETARELAENLSSVSQIVHQRLTEEIDPLRGDTAMLERLAASVESNLEAFSRMVRYEGAMERVDTPPAAAEYARRLAQRGTDPSALLRAYRLGQETALLWTLDRVAARDAPREVAMGAFRCLVRNAFRYIDAISAQVLSEYDAERARWLANTNSVRSAMLADLLARDVPDIGAAETALGYRLRQHHVAVVLWLDRDGSPSDLRALEHVLTRIGKQAGTRGTPFFVPQDRSTAWGWLPLGREGHPPLTADRTLLAELAELDARVALGSASAGSDGFRASHREAQRARELALVSGQVGRRFTSFADQDVRAATMLMTDMDATRRMVRETLGELATDDEAAARLRETVRTFLDSGGSFVETAERLSLHKNTVRYRLERAAEARGRALDDDRLDLELALIACRWLGSCVLPRSWVQHSGTPDPKNASHGVPNIGRDPPHRVPEEHVDRR